MPEHYGEAYIEGNEWGWQCLTPGCRYEITGLESIWDAEDYGDQHMDTGAVGA